MVIYAKRDMFSPIIEYKVLISPGPTDSTLLFSVIGDVNRMFVKSNTLTTQSIIGPAEEIIEAYKKLQNHNELYPVAAYKALNRILKN